MDLSNVQLTLVQCTGRGFQPSSQLKICVVLSQYVSGESNGRCGGNNKRTRIRGGTSDLPGCPLVKNPPVNVGTQVQYLVWEDPTCHGATKPLCHSYWNPCSRAHVLQWEAFTLQLERSLRLSQLEKSPCVHAKSLQLCLTLFDPMDCSPPGSSVQVSQATGVGCHFLLQGIFLT